MTTSNIEKCYLGLLAIGTETTSKDLAEYLEINPKNIGRYLMQMVLLNHCIDRAEEVGRKRYHYFSLTEEGKIEAEKIQKGFHLEKPSLIPEKKSKPTLKQEQIKSEIEQTSTQIANIKKNLERTDLTPENKEELENLLKLKEQQLPEYIALIPKEIVKKPSLKESVKTTVKSNEMKNEAVRMFLSLPVRKIDIKPFGFKTAAEFRARFIELIRLI